MRNGHKRVIKGVHFEPVSSAAKWTRPIASSQFSSWENKCFEIIPSTTETWISSTDTARIEDVISAIGRHLESWKLIYDIDLVSITTENSGVTAKFSGELPANERLAVGLMT